MPANDKLQWYDIDDMTAGVWDDGAVKARFAAPAKSFRTLTGYQPLKGGGLRAAFAANTTISMSGVGANEVITGIWARNGVSRSVANGGTGSDSTDMVIVTRSTADFKNRVYRRDGTVGSPAWSLRTTTAAAASAGHQITDFAYFKDSNGVEWLAISMFGFGLYSMRFDFATTSNTGNDGLVAVLTASFGGPVCVSQNRILVGAGNDASINWSNVGLTTGWGGSNFLKVADNRAEANVSILSGIEPSDLLVGKEGAPWVVINGDIANTSTPVREMGDDHHQRQNKQQCPRVPGGIAFIEGSGRVFVTGDGRTFNSLSDQLAAFSLNISPGMVGTGTMAYLNSLLFAPGPNGTINVYDFDTGAWHRLTDIDFTFGWADPYSGTIWCANHQTAAPAVVGINVMDSGSRATTGVIETVPYADKNGRNLDVREVQLFVETHAAGQNTFQVDLVDQTGAIPSGATRRATVVGGQRQMVRFLFPATKSEYLSCRITTTAPTSAVPTIERIRIGFGINNIVA